LTAVVLRNDADDLLLYTNMGRQAYRLPSDRWVTFFRALRFVRMATVGLAIALFGPTGPWKAAFAALLGSLAAEIIEAIALRALQKADDTLSLKDFQEEALAQESTGFLVFFAVGLGVITAGGLAIAARKGAPGSAVMGLVLAGLACIFFVLRLRAQRKLLRP
jgi:hypothetical protein